MGETSRQMSGHLQDSLQGRRLVYSNRCGRILLNNVTVHNQGVDWADESNIYWQHKVRSCAMHLAPCSYVVKLFEAVKLEFQFENACVCTGEHWLVCHGFGTLLMQCCSAKA